MKRKIVLITVELIEESVGSSNKKIVDDLVQWFREDIVSMPWVKEVREIKLKEDDV
ncbi:MAG: hypothetical protein QW468_04385 [Candidatus Bathyarchaeia archaeon]